MDGSVISIIFSGAIISLAIAACLGIIPAVIAYKKGYSFLGWWFYGWMLFIVAFIHSLFLPDKNAKAQSSIESLMHGQSVADELKKYKELKDQGVISEEEFQAKKKQLLKLV